VVERGGRSEVAATGGNFATAVRDSNAALRTDADLAQPTGSGEADRAETLRDSRGLALSSRQLDRRGDERCPAVFEEEPELLPVLIENAVAIGGAVRRPGAYPVAGATTAAGLAAIAEGILGGTTGMTLDLIRARGADTVQERIATTGFAEALATTRVAPGDDLRFNAAQAQFETGAVLLSGEFNRPGLYSIRKGETLAQLLARAGGVSPLAYPYGAIFTRRSVKELQQEGLRRTSRELTTALLAVSARKETSGEALLAGQALISQLATVEVPGRVVVEADPRVLAVRPDLDTVLESGDAVVMPKKPNFVLALGDVSNPGALQFVPGKLARDYLREAGGAQASADRGRAFLVLPNGTAMPLGGRGWGRGGDMKPAPGSTIIVPKNIDPLYKLEVARDVSTILGSLISSVATVGLLATR
jgi:polysaccharide biosynthesis/export protein